MVLFIEWHQYILFFLLFQYGFVHKWRHVYIWERDKDFGTTEEEPYSWKAWQWDHKLSKIEWHYLWTTPKNIFMQRLISLSGIEDFSISDSNRKFCHSYSISLFPTPFSGNKLNEKKNQEFLFLMRIFISGYKILN